MNKTFKVICFILLLGTFSTYTPSNKKDNSFLFPIKKILIVNNSILETKEIKNKLMSLMGKNLLIFNEKNLDEHLSTFDFISGWQVKKIYPNTVKISITEKQPVAIFQKGKQKFYISKKGELMKFIEILELNNLPIVIGGEKNFSNFYFELKRIKFPINEIKTYLFYDLERWDIILKDNKIIKLPVNNIVFSLKNYLNFRNDSNFKNYKIFDYRIKDQLILK